MDEHRYTNRELDHFLTDMKGQLDRIEKQTTRTNGRTTKNEQELIRLNTKINTSVLVVAVMLPVLLSLVTWIFFDQLASLQSAIPSIVSGELDGYEFQITE